MAVDTAASLIPACFRPMPAFVTRKCHVAGANRLEENRRNRAVAYRTVQMAAAMKMVAPFEAEFVAGSVLVEPLALQFEKIGVVVAAVLVGTCPCVGFPQTLAVHFPQHYFPRVHFAHSNRASPHFQRSRLHLNARLNYFAPNSAAAAVAVDFAVVAVPAVVAGAASADAVGFL